MLCWVESLVCVCVKHRPLLVETVTWSFGCFLGDVTKDRSCPLVMTFQISSVTCLNTHTHTHRHLYKICFIFVLFFFTQMLILIAAIGTVHLSNIPNALKGVVHFEINFWYVLAYLKGIQDAGVSSSFNFDIFRSNHLCLSVI